MKWILVIVGVIVVLVFVKNKSDKSKKELDAKLPDAEFSTKLENRVEREQLEASAASKPKINISSDLWANSKPALSKILTYIKIGDTDDQAISRVLSSAYYSGYKELQTWFDTNKATVKELLKGYKLDIDLSGKRLNVIEPTTKTVATAESQVQRMATDAEVQEREAAYQALSAANSSQTGGKGRKR